MKNAINQLNRTINRRSLLADFALGSIAMTLPAVMLAQQNLVVTHLRNNIHLIAGAGCNVVVSVGPDSVLLVDGGVAEFSEALLQEVDRLAQGKPVRTLFNTNWRPEHCGLNQTLGSTGVDIIAHENTRLWQNNDFYVDWEERHYSPMPAAAQANKTFYKQSTLVHGSETVDFGRVGECHTDGDIYIRFNDSNILVAGDMMTVSTYPLLDYVTGGWIGGAQESTAGLLELADADTLIIPANGAPQGLAALELQKQMLDHAYEKVAEAYRTGRSLDQFLAATPMSEYDDNFGDSTLFVRLLYRGAWYHVTSRAIPGII